MVFSPIILALLTGLSTAGFINLTAKDNQDGTTTISDGNNPIITINPQSEVFTNEKPLKSAKVQFNRIASTVQAKAGQPNIKLVNIIPNNRIYHVSLIPDASFKTLGNCVIRVGNSDLLSIQGADLTDTDAFSIPLPPEGLILEQGSNVEVFIWSQDGTSVTATVMILTGVKS